MKVFRSYKILTALTVFFSSLVGVGALLLLDEVNNLRSPFLNNNFLSTLIAKMGMERIDFSAKGFACFFLTYFDCVALFFALLYSGTLGLYFRIQNRKFNLKLYYIAVWLMFLIIFVGGLLFFDMKPYGYLELAIIYGYFFVFFFIAASLFFLLFLLVSFIYSRVKREKFTFPVNEALPDLEGDREVLAMAQEASNRSLFPSLIRIDEKYSNAKFKKLPACNVLSLKDLAEGFREYTYSKYAQNYNLSCVRSFISGLAMSKLVFVHGDGDDAVRFVQYFSEYLNGICSCIEVQKEWDSDSDMLGYYSERESQFMCSSFIEKVYEAAFNEERVNFIAFSNMGEANIDDYFGSVFNAVYHNSDDPLLNLMRIRRGEYTGKVPQKLKDGSILIEQNTWVLGTLTNTVAETRLAEELAEDFVVVNIMKSRAKIVADKRRKCLNMHAKELNELFVFAGTTEKFKLTVPELERFLSVADYVYDSFNIRIDGVIIDYVQIFVSCYVYCGGSKEEALDLVFQKKIFGKLKGLCGDHIVNGLMKLDSKIIECYGKGAFKLTRTEIKKEIERLKI